MEEANFLEKIRSDYPRDFLVSYLNINSLRFKIHDIRDLLMNIPIDLFGIAETKLDPSFPDSQFYIQGYRLFRKDRTDRGGGQAVYVRSDIPCRRIKTLECKSVETIALELRPNNKVSFLVVIAYRPPKSLANTFMTEMSALLDQAMNDYNFTWILGDLNYDILHQDRGRPVHDLCDLYNLEQLIIDPTNTTLHGQTLIDVIITNSPQKVSSSGCKNIGLSDSHSLIYATIKFQAPRLPRTVITYRKYKNFDAEHFSRDVGRIPLVVSQIFDDPNDNYWAYQMLLKEVIEDHAPLKTIKIKSRQAPFMNKTLKQAVWKKKRLQNRYARFPTPANWEAYRKQRNHTVKLRRHSIRDYFNSKCEGGAKNTTFWPTIKPFLTNKGSKNTENIMLKHDNKLVTKPSEVSQLLNDFYVNIAADIGDNIDLNQNTESNQEFVVQCANHFKDHPSVKNISEKMNKCNFTFRHTTPDEVAKVIKSLDSTKATGHDKIPAKLVRLLPGNISTHLAQIFNLSIDTCSFPDDAKLAEVVPAFKKDGNLIMKNYRPISILPVCSKILEKLMLLQMTPFLDEILSPRIAAYRRGYGCHTVLLRLIEDWKQALERSMCVGTTMMDLSKAFDCLPHQLVVAKMHTYGASKQSCALIWSYLHNRMQRVRINGHQLQIQIQIQIHFIQHKTDNRLNTIYILNN
jgi:hypothetical protein